MLAAEANADTHPTWTWRDRMLVLAFEMYDSSLCDGCAQRRDRAMNPDIEGWLEARPNVCFGCAALENARNEKNQPKGVKYYLVDSGPPDEELMPWTIDLQPDE